MCHGVRGIHGNSGILESVTYRIYRVLSGSNPTLSANLSFCVFNSLTGYVGSQRAMSIFVARCSASNPLKIAPRWPRGCHFHHSILQALAHWVATNLREPKSAAPTRLQGFAMSDRGVRGDSKEGKQK